MTNTSRSRTPPGQQVKAGELRGDETLEATATITVRGVSEDVVVTGTIALS
jgi:voltage-gated potassium channel Kch